MGSVAPISLPDNITGTCGGDPESGHQLGRTLAIASANFEVPASNQLGTSCVRAVQELVDPSAPGVPGPLTDLVHVELSGATVAPNHLAAVEFLAFLPDSSGATSWLGLPLPEPGVVISLGMKLVPSGASTVSTVFPGNLSLTLADPRVGVFGRLYDFDLIAGQGQWTRSAWITGFIY